ncbi:serine/threonine-protein phosphatase 6 regulatory ankyrin repeat subunit B-like [Cherax quadricarinatus]|uniref:serine/threonine-protein phosphatase 6 regulatory ankyrin repeat subunit B-like n=1 Tax=Cherax quadricarinatus TaxID=27406 RepID=UPI00387E4351
MLQAVTYKRLEKLRENIPIKIDGNIQDANGRTILHWAAERGYKEVVEVLLETCKVYPHVLTWAAETPDDLARQARHYIGFLSQRYDTPLSYEKEIELYEKLLNVISKSDDVSEATRLLRSRAPMEPVGQWSVYPLSLAITSNRLKIINLLVAAGAPLTTTNHGVNLLTLAWLTPDVTIPVQVTITRVFRHVLQYELGQINNLSTTSKGVDNNIVSTLRGGVKGLIVTLQGDTPWMVCWSPGMSVEMLTELMVQAAGAKCTLTCSFLYQAGAQSSLCTKCGMTPVHAALEAGHWDLAEHIIKDMGGSVYIPDNSGQLPTSVMNTKLRKTLEKTSCFERRKLKMLEKKNKNIISEVHTELCQTLEKTIYIKERHQLEDLLEKTKSPSDKQLVQEFLKIQELLFNKTNPFTQYEETLVLNIGYLTLLVASRKGLQQLIYLLVKRGGLAVDTLVDNISDTTALHEAASHGKSSCVLLLLNLGAQPLKPDRYNQTPSHLSAMFGHHNVYKLLEIYHTENEPSCRAGTSPQNVHSSFLKYLKMYNKNNQSTNIKIEHQNNSREVTMNLLKQNDLNQIVEDVEKVTVDYATGEALEVKDAVMKELQNIIKNIPDKTYKGDLILLGSSADSTRLYCPDEYDVNIVLNNFSSIEFIIIEQTQEEAFASGHKLRMKPKHSHFGGSNFVNKFYECVKDCLKSYTLGDTRLSLVPPGLTRTQVGVALSLAWQGDKYPLLLIGIDLVPVVAVPWLKKISRPFLTPETSKEIHLSNTEDGSWRCSFSATEVEVLQHLDHQERKVFLTAKSLLSCMKAEPWMPSDVKNKYCWWDSRYWKIPIPAGFCLKNSFLRFLEKKRNNEEEYQGKDLLTLVKCVFQEMCQEMVDPTTGAHSLVPAKVNAYFGGDCEKPKIGEGAPEIVKYIKKKLQKS